MFFTLKFTIQKRTLVMIEPVVAFDQIFLQKEDYPMLKIAVHYTRYALAMLATVGFGLTTD
jgi:hypothetical protein